MAIIADLNTKKVKRRVLVLAVSAVLSLIIVLVTMQAVCYFLNEIYGTSYHLPMPHVTWLVK
jgi:hypothetical protein